MVRAASVAVRTVARVRKLNMDISDLEIYAKVIEADPAQRTNAARKPVHEMYVWPFQKADDAM